MVKLNYNKARDNIPKTQKMHVKTWEWNFDSSALHQWLPYFHVLLCESMTIMWHRWRWLTSIVFPLQITPTKPVFSSISALNNNAFGFFTIKTSLLFICISYNKHVFHAKKQIRLDQILWQSNLIIICKKTNTLFTIKTSLWPSNLIIIWLDHIFVTRINDICCETCDDVITTTLTTIQTHSPS